MTQFWDREGERQTVRAARGVREKGGQPSLAQPATLMRMGDFGNVRRDLSWPQTILFTVLLVAVPLACFFAAKWLDGSSCICF